MSVQHHNNHNSAATIIAIPIVAMTSYKPVTRKKAQISKPLSNENSQQKPVISSLLQSRLYELVGGAHTSGDADFDLQDDYKLNSEADERDMILPILIPVKFDFGAKKQKVATAIINAAKKDTLAYAFALQVLEWNILNAKLNS